MEEGFANSITNMIDPSGEFGVAGAVVGGLVGAAMGFVFGRWQSGTTYDLVTANLCGCERKMALQGKTRDQYVGQAQAVGAGLGAAIGAVSGAFAGSGVVAFVGAVLELYGKIEALKFGIKIIDDFRRDLDIDDWCNVSDFFFAMLDIGLGVGLQYVGGKLNGATGDPNARQPDLLGDSLQQVLNAWDDIDLNVYFSTPIMPVRSRFWRGRATIPTGNARSGWLHIEGRHISGTIPAGVGHPTDFFPPTTTRAQLSSAANTIISKGTRISAPNRRIQVFERRITINRFSSNVRVVVDTATAEIVTMFPVGKSYR